MISVHGLATVWQPRFYDGQRDPKHTRNSIRKPDYPTCAQVNRFEQPYKCGERGNLKK
jgi:hypothetical protein